MALFSHNPFTCFPLPCAAFLLMCSFTMKLTTRKKKEKGGRRRVEERKRRRKGRRRMPDPFCFDVLDPLVCIEERGPIYNETSKSQHGAALLYS